MIWCSAERVHDRVSNFPFVVLSGVACNVDRERELTTVDAERESTEDFFRIYNGTIYARARAHLQYFV